VGFAISSFWHLSFHFKFDLIERLRKNHLYHYWMAIDDVEYPIPQLPSSESHVEEVHR